MLGACTVTPSLITGQGHCGVPCDRLAKHAISSCQCSCVVELVAPDPHFHYHLHQEHQCMDGTASCVKHRQHQCTPSHWLPCPHRAVPQQRLCACMHAAVAAGHTLHIHVASFVLLVCTCTVTGRCEHEEQAEGVLSRVDDIHVVG